MTWNPSWPEGNKSVKDNKPRGNSNMQYIEDKLRLDHYWDEDATKDGYHKQVDMPNLAADPSALPSVGVNGQFYVRAKTSIEATAAQQTEAFFASLNGASLLYNQLGFRCIASWNGGSSAPTQANVVYSHNLALQASSPAGIVRNGEGLYTINFLNPLPSINYSVFGCAMRNDNSNSLYVSIRNASDLGRSARMNVSWVQISFQYEGGTRRDPDYASICIVGG